ncbi:hypothetical protein K474DRAFT_1712146 [Panus rudis PR-1116 ss-1]|nr:hypothetical protein K474DRAFT_1712146 [Panus rudis PR-1116 ss-1]
MTEDDPYDLFFTGKDDPRDGCIMMGHVGARPIYYHCETTTTTNSTRTTFYRDANPVAQFEWSLGYHLGNLNVGRRQIPMTYLVMPGTIANARMFASGTRRYEWRRTTDGGYDLHEGPSSRIGGFRRFPQPRETPVGPAHALLQYTFDNDELMLDCLLALSINRWIDLHGL